MDTVASPEAAIQALSRYCARVGKPFNEASNLRRLIGTLELEMGREEGAKLGIGDLDDARFERGIQLLVETKQAPRKPKASELFDRSFLPPLESRVRNLYSTPP